MPESFLEPWVPMDPDLGPPLPRWLKIYWPWYQAMATEYTCPYCGLPFDSVELLADHVQAVHPGERIPILIQWS